MRQRSFAEAVKLGHLTGANAIPVRVSAIKRLEFSKYSRHFEIHDRQQFHPGHAKSPAGFSLAGNGGANRAGFSNLNLSLSQSGGTQYLQKGYFAGICSRCLSDKHLRRACLSPIRCLACLNWGHIAVNCTAANRFCSTPQGPSGRINGKRDLAQPKWFSGDAHRTLGPGTSSPPRFQSFSDWWVYTAPSQASTSPPEPITVPWKLPKNPMTVGQIGKGTHSAERDPEANTTLQLGNPAASRVIYTGLSPHRTTAVTVRQENLNQHSVLATQSYPEESSGVIMAFQRADPRPFLSRGMTWEDVPNRPLMVRAVASSRPQPQNENVAIATISPLPGNPLNFAVVREVLREFLEDREHVPLVDIQPCHLGQAYVRFQNNFDRDNYVLESPHPFDDVNISFTRHNQGRNWRRVIFNQECWLMFLGLHLDYWDQEYIETVLAPFAKIIDWHADDRRKVRVLARARVADLEAVPQFIVLSDIPGFEGESWTIQCEIVQREMLGAGPQDEDIPEQVQIQGQLPFDFFGLGQNVQNQQVEPPQQQLQEQMDGAPNNEAIPQVNNGWADWPEHLQVAQQGPAQIEINLNAPPPVLLQDLNDLPIPEDPQEVLIHPGMQTNQVQNNWELGMANNAQMEQEIHLPQPAQPEPVEAMIEEVAENAVDIAPIHLLNEDNNFLHLEIQEDELMNDDEIQEQINEQNMDWQLNHVQEDQIQLGMVRIYDRFYPNVTGPFDLITRKAQLTEQPFPIPPTKPKSNDHNPDGKATETALIEVPRKWADFFQVFLNSPESFTWAKNLLATQFPAYLPQSSDAVNLSLPSEPYNRKAELCGKLGSFSSSIIPEEAFILDEELNVTTPEKKKQRKGKMKSPVVESEVRRSIRVRGQTNGFKPSGCKITNCLGCKVQPPNLSIATLQAIGAEMCQINPEEVNEAALNKRKKPKPIMKKGKNKENDDKAEDGEGPSKERKTA